MFNTLVCVYCGILFPGLDVRKVLKVIVSHVTRIHADAHLISVHCLCFVRHPTVTLFKVMYETSLLGISGIKPFLFFGYCTVCV